MKGAKFNSPGRRLRVLVAPLEWGLGHSTRCIPIIRSLLQYDCEVFIAAEGACQRLLQEEFPDLAFYNVKGYRVEYSRKKIWMPVKMLIQIPRIFLSIYTERRWLKGIVKQHSIDAVISDNRFGMYHSSIYSVYITHQLKIKTGNRVTEWLAKKIHYHYINKYDECWVPDTGEKTGLAGALSHPAALPAVPVKYLGPLSRFEKKEEEIKYDLAIILSGPEPQRSIFENKILEDIKNYHGHLLLVRGLPGQSMPPLQNPSLEIKDHLGAEELNRVILQSKMILSRCGYTTVMDLVKLGKKAILIPTPGQTEQEYLAGYLMQKKMFFCISQESFSLNDVLKKAEDFPFTETYIEYGAYKKVIEEFVKSCVQTNQ